MKTVELKAKGFTIDNGVITSPNGQRSITVHAICGDEQAWFTGEFFSSDHCQKLPGIKTVPTTFYLPQQVAPREGLESGIVDSLESWKLVYSSATIPLIPNPDPDYCVEGNT